MKSRFTVVSAAVALMSLLSGCGGAPSDSASEESREESCSGLTAQEAVDALGEMPACPTDGSAKDIEAATEEIKAYANDLRAATNDLDVAVKALAPAEE